MTTLVSNMLRGARSIFHLYPSDELRSTRFSDMPETAEQAFREDLNKMGDDFHAAVKTFEKSLQDGKK